MISTYFSIIDGETRACAILYMIHSGGRLNVSTRVIQVYVPYMSILIKGDLYKKNRRG